MWRSARAHTADARRAATDRLRRTRARAKRAGPVIAVVVMLTLVVVAILAERFDWLGIGSACNGNGAIACGIATNALVALLAAAIAVVALFGRKTRRALDHYVTVARDEPEKLVHWAHDASPALAEIRADLASRTADQLARPGPGRLVILRGGRGAGKTAFLAQLTRELVGDRITGEHGRVLPLPVSLRDAASVREIGPRTREAFVDCIDAKVASDGDADVIWRWARRTRRLVVLLDDLDSSRAMRRRTGRTRRDLAAALDDMGREEISVVLATDSDPELALHEAAPVWVELDGIDRAAAQRYIEHECGEEAVTPAVADAIASLERGSGTLHRRALAEVRQIAQLCQAGELADALPGNRDRRRAELLERWVQAVEENRVACDELAFGRADAARERARRRAATAVAVSVAEALLDAKTDSVPRAGFPPDAIEDAIDLGLLQARGDRLCFPTAGLEGLFLARQSSEDGTKLEQLAAGAWDGSGGERWFPALLVWSALHPDHPVTADAASRFADRADRQARQDGAHPRLVAAAARLALVAGSPAHDDKIARAAVALRPRTSAADRRAMVDVCSRLAATEAVAVMQHYLRDDDERVQWEAARSLANVPAERFSAVADGAQAMVERVDTSGALEWGSDDTRTLCSLVWVLPTLCDAGAVDPALFEHAEGLCRAREVPAPLAEAALARGLRLAAWRGRSSTWSGKRAQDWLDGRDQPKTWMARLVLVQALAVHARHAVDRGDEAEGERLAARLGEVETSDPHPLVREAAWLASRAPRMTQFGPGTFAWRSERGAVASVPGDALRLSRIAGDAILLSNTIAAVGESDPATATELATRTTLPACLGRPAAANGSASCDCQGYDLCVIDRRRLAVRRRAAPLTRAFCQEQERVIGLIGAPPWGPPKRARRAYWRQLAELAP